MKNTQAPTIGVIGTGLIGTSLALALKDNDPEQKIVGYDVNESHAYTAKSKGAFDHIADNPRMLAKQCDILIIATPVGVIRDIFAQLKHAADRVIITDVGSVKRSVIADARSIWGSVPTRMVPAHPIAGAEENGPSVASKDLFRSRYVFITPLSQNDETALNTVRELWQKVGGYVEILSPARHDKLFAATSHLPHIIAYALINALEESGVNIAFSAGGLRDFTRIAASDPKMWRDICLANSDYILESMKFFEQSIKTMCDMIEKGHGDRLFELLKKTTNEKAKLNLKD